MKDEEIKLEEIEVSHTLRWSGELILYTQCHETRNTTLTNQFLILTRIGISLHRSQVDMDIQGSENDELFENPEVEVDHIKGCKTLCAGEFKLAHVPVVMSVLFNELPRQSPDDSGPGKDLWFVWETNH
jgi:hypothetical protein